MGRPPEFSAETKIWIVLSVLSGETIVAGAAGEEKVSEQSIGRWKADFLEAGKRPAWGHRKVWVMVRHTGDHAPPSTVLRLAMGQDRARELLTSGR